MLVTRAITAYYSMIALLICALTVIALSADDCRYLRRDRAILHAPMMSHEIYISQRRYLDVMYTCLDTLLCLLIIGSCRSYLDHLILICIDVSLTLLIFEFLRFSLMLIFSKNFPNL